MELAAGPSEVGSQVMSEALAVPRSAALVMRRNWNSASPVWSWSRSSTVLQYSFV